VDEELVLRLEALGRQFFALDKATKARIGMAHGGRA
jgi:hypothetical protein